MCPPDDPAANEIVRLAKLYATDELRAAELFDLMLDTLVRPHHRSVSWGDRLMTLDKARGFLTPEFRAALTPANRQTGHNQYTSPDAMAWRLNTLVFAARNALSVPGDFVECGVFHGDMSWLVTEVVPLGDSGRIFYLFDTFAGFSAKWSSPDDFPDATSHFEFLHKRFSPPNLFAEVRDRFAAKPYVRVIQGVVPDVFAEASPDVIAYLHIDMNSPGPEGGALLALFDRVSTGGLIVLDDYGWLPHSEQKKAHDKFMCDRGHDILELPTGQGLVIKR
jgi:O-methyltransferase